MTDTPSPLSIKDLSVRYGGQSEYALENINWEVTPAKLSAIVGPNGAGKSTLLKASMGFLSTQSGSISFSGQPFKAVRKKVAYMPQRSSVDWDFPVSVLDVAAMGLYGQIGWFKAIKKHHKALAMKALKQVGLEDLADRQIGALSGGQQQRTFLARALTQDADLYLMDEPFAGVDMATEQKIIEILKSLKKRGKTIIVVHHNLATVENVFDEALLLNQSVIASGTVKKVMSKKNLAAAYNAPLSYLDHLSNG